MIDVSMPYAIFKIREIVRFGGTITGMVSSSSDTVLKFNLMIPVTYRVTYLPYKNKYSAFVEGTSLPFRAFFQSYQNIHTKRILS